MVSGEKPGHKNDRAFCLSDKWFVSVTDNIADCRSAATGSIPVRTAIIKNQFYAHSCNEIVSKDFIEETIM
jgi:hypothetical protein